MCFSVAFFRFPVILDGQLASRPNTEQPAMVSGLTKTETIRPYCSLYATGDV
jgi:hypothetical protein